MSHAGIELRQVGKRYGDARSPLVVKGIDLVVPKGSLTTLLGPSGCGKTTTLRMIAGLDAPSSGRILIDGVDVTALGPAERNVSMVFQSYALFPHMSVLDNVGYGLSVQGVSRDETARRARATMDLVGLAGYDARLPSELSGGQQQRVAVARSLVLEPSVMLFDEPLSNLDAKLRRRVREEIRDIQTSLGLTVVYVTHDQEEALAVSDRIIVMNNAVIAQTGTPRELYEAPDTAFVADFIGEANILPCEIENVKEGRATVRIDGLSVTLAARGLAKGPAKLAVRPNRIVLGPPAEKTPFPGTLRKATYVGSHWEYSVETAVGDLFAKALDGDSRLSVGGPVAVSFATEGPVLLPG